MFCEKCGSAFDEKKDASQNKVPDYSMKKCSNCGFEKYFNPIPVAVSMIPVLGNDGKMYLLGIKRGIQPFKGGLALPGGFQEVNPVHQEAAIDLAQKANGLENVYKENVLVMSSEPNPNRTLMFFESKVVLKESEIDFGFKDAKGEIEGIELLSKDSEICFSLHKKAIDHFFKNNK